MGIHVQNSSQFGDAAVEVFTFDSSVRVFFVAVAFMAFVAVGMRSRMFSVWRTLQEQVGGGDVSGTVFASKNAMKRSSLFRIAPVVGVFAAWREAFSVVAAWDAAMGVFIGGGVQPPRFSSWATRRQFSLRGILPWAFRHCEGSHVDFWCSGVQPRGLAVRHTAARFLAPVTAKNKARGA